MHIGLEQSMGSAIWRTPRTHLLHTDSASIVYFRPLESHAARCL